MIHDDAGAGKYVCASVSAVLCAVLYAHLCSVPCMLSACVLCVMQGACLLLIVFLFCKGVLSSLMCACVTWEVLLNQSMHVCYSTVLRYTYILYRVGSSELCLSHALTMYTIQSAAPCVAASVQSVIRCPVDNFFTISSSLVHAFFARTIYTLQPIPLIN